MLIITLLVLIITLLVLIISSLQDAEGTFISDITFRIQYLTPYRYFLMFTPNCGDFES